MLDKYMFAFGRGVRGAKKAWEQVNRAPDPADSARDVTPADAAMRAAPTRPLPPSPVFEGNPTTPAVVKPLARRPLVLGPRPLVMGIVNVTPDSFSDGGDFVDPARAIEHGFRLLSEGADILDIGGESTRPNHAFVDAQTEIQRVVPVIRALAAATDVPISIDSMKAEVAAAALDAGASIVNDVWGLQRDPGMASLVAERGVPVIVMHNRDHDDPSVDMLAEVMAFLRRSIEIATVAGVAREKIIIDPGIGFGKTHAQSLGLMRDLARLQELGAPILLGVSRKRVIGHATAREAPRDRMAGSVAAAVLGAAAGAAIVRVHDVAAHIDAMKMFAAIRYPETGEAP
jgi:dihydropteroate synthase